MKFKSRFFNVVINTWELFVCLLVSILDEPIKQSIVVEQVVTLSLVLPLVCLLMVLFEKVVDS